MQFSLILGFAVGPAVGGGLQEVCEKVHWAIYSVLFWFWAQRPIHIYSTSLHSMQASCCYGF